MIYAQTTPHRILTQLRPWLQRGQSRLERRYLRGQLLDAGHEEWRHRRVFYPQVTILGVLADDVRAHSLYVLGEEPLVDLGRRVVLPREPDSVDLSSLLQCIFNILSRSSLACTQLELPAAIVSFRELPIATVIWVELLRNTLPVML